MNDKPEIEVGKLPVITKFIYTLGVLPTSYLMSMTYQEQVTWLYNYLQTQVIPAINTDVEAVQELQTLYELLRTYVNDYFDNLDIQEEINNKLDEMAESGELGQIISQYINNNVTRTYSTINDMIEDLDLTNNMKAQINGYYKSGDGGNASYSITNEEPLEGQYEILDNGNYALLISDYIVPEIFGAFGDGVHDDIVSLRKCFDYCKTFHKTMYGVSNKIYGISDTFTIESGCSVDFNGATIKALNIMESVVCQHKRIETVQTTGTTGEYTKNITIDCDGKALYGFYQDTLGWSIYTDNIIVNTPMEVGIYIKTGQIRLYNSKVNQLNNLIDSIGLKIDSPDSYYNNIVTRNCRIGIQINRAGNSFTDCHPVITSNNYINSSIGFDLYGSCDLVNPVIDTFKYAINVNHNSGFNLINPNVAIATDYYTTERVDSAPYFLHFNSDNINYTSRIFICGCRLPYGEIYNNEKIKFSNMDSWIGSSITLNNPALLLYNDLSLPKELNQLNTNISISSNIESGFTASTPSLTFMGNIVYFRIPSLTLPNINAESSARAFSGIDSKYMSSVTIAHNSITKNGVPVTISMRSTGAIDIVPHGNVTEGDILYISTSYIKL